MQVVPNAEAAPPILSGYSRFACVPHWHLPFPSAIHQPFVHVHHPAHRWLHPLSPPAATIANSSPACRSSFAPLIRPGFNASLRCCRSRASLGIRSAPNPTCSALQLPPFARRLAGSPANTANAANTICRAYTIRCAVSSYSSQLVIVFQIAAPTSSCRPSFVGPAGIVRAYCPLHGDSSSCLSVAPKYTHHFSFISFDIICAIDCRTPAVSQSFHHCPALHSLASHHAPQ